VRKCRDCQERKDVSEFYVCQVTAKGVTYYSSYCKPCNILRNTTYGAGNLARRKVYMRRSRNKYKGTWTWKARQIHEGMVNRSAKRGFGYPEFTIPEVRSIIEGGNCQRTGIPFEIDTTRKSPWGPSPDRIDNSLGYTKDNVQWVCVMFNTMKSDFTEDDVSKFMDAVRTEGDF
jgi:hypothetical protein